MFQLKLFSTDILNLCTRLVLTRKEKYVEHRL